VTPAELDTVVTIAAEASALVDRIYQKPFKVDYKGPLDPVTEADRAANDLICARLSDAFPGSPVVAEESAPESFADFRRYERVFFVDPVDGTREFVEKNGEFVVMIGVLEDADAVASVIFAPATGASWVGLVGHGAYGRDASGVRHELCVSSTSELARARVVASRSHRTPDLEQVLGGLGALEIRSVGSAGLKGAHVAEGWADAYVSPHYAGKRWDVCPSDALVVAAGGRVTDAHGQKIDYRAASLVNDTGMVVTNGVVHDAILEVLAAARRDGATA
jgi:3'(2'), 5'-bisphosphate nucleotidase